METVKSLSAQLHEHEEIRSRPKPAAAEDSVLGLPARHMGSRHEGVVGEVEVLLDYTASRKYMEHSFPSHRQALEAPSKVVLTPESRELHTAPETQLPIPCFRDPTSVLKLHFRTTKHHTRAGMGLQTGWARYKSCEVTEVADDALAKASMHEILGGEHKPEEELHKIIVGMPQHAQQAKNSNQETPLWMEEAGLHQIAASTSEVNELKDKLKKLRAKKLFAWEKKDFKAPAKVQVAEKNPTELTPTARDELESERQRTANTG